MHLVLGTISKLAYGQDVKKLRDGDVLSLRVGVVVGRRLLGASALIGLGLLKCKVPPFA